VEENEKKKGRRREEGRKGGLVSRQNNGTPTMDRKKDGNRFKENAANLLWHLA
jgi:hypothetical protein